MSRITDDEVAHVARLARLDVGPAERAQLRGELEQILEAAAVLERVDTEGVPPTPHAIERRNVFRPDDVEPSLPQEAALANAPRVEDGYFKVPRILEEA